MMPQYFIIHFGKSLLKAFMKSLNRVLLLGLLLILIGCQEEAPNPDQTEAPALADVAEPTKQKLVPPTTPIFEDFQGEPTLSLFPRVGDYRPETEDERLPYWNTFIDHLSKVSGLVQNPEDGNKAWSIRSINSIDSLGYFSPLAVEPNTSYRLSFKLKAQLAEGASAGIGILEFDEFLWIGEQYTEQTLQKHYRGVHEGIRRTGNSDWEEYDTTFTTHPETHMIHLVLFRDGTHDRNGILFDDIMMTLNSNR
jgi:hypothetical protein